MKAVIYKAYGAPEVLKFIEMDKPQPKDNEILIKIHNASVTSGDVRLRASDFPPLFWLPARLIFGLFKPKKKILGHELSGTVEAKGTNVKRFNIGDEVFGTTTMLNTGSYAEYICVPENWKHGVMELKPKNISFKEAATIPVGAMAAMFLLKKAKLDSNQNVLIYGASGSVGSYAVQLANLKTPNVTAVCSGTNFDMVTALGAKKLIDYKIEDFSKIEEKFDIVFDAVGKTTKSRAKKVLKPDGIFVSVNMLTKEKSDYLLEIKDLAERKELKSFIDKSFGLEDIVRAHEYVDKGRKRGNVAIDIVKD